MKLKAITALALAGLMAGALLAPGVAHAKKKKKAGPLVVGTDAPGDWGNEVDPTLAPLGDALGQDLIEATVEMADKETVNFIIKLNSLPAPGGAPEVSRYTWDFMVGSEFTELDGKFTNYSRGICDPTSGQCPPPRDPGMSPFFIRGNCAAVETVTTCEELGVVQAVFDAATATITIPVPLELIGAKHGTKIGPAANLFGGTISATPAAFLSSGNAPMDTMVVTETFVISAK